ncbi:MAG: ABC transporter ATP-binding protein [Deltaproteobacteria bacterium]|nr:ABC transporter ATP-binding protein [Deltaproteobacteria bacterium]
MKTILETRGLKKYFGGLHAIDGVDFRVEAGELRCLIGPNGAGKSSLFKLIIGTYEPSQGRIIFKDEDITRLQPYRRVQNGISMKFQVPGVFRELSSEENLRVALHRAYQGDELTERVESLLDLLGLQSHRRHLAGNLSHGQQQWLEIGMALGVNPSILLLDEPTAGMSVEETYKTGELVKRLNADRMTVVIIEHDMTFIRQIASKVTVLHFGKIFVEGTLDEIMRNEDVVRIYLGKA